MMGSRDDEYVALDCGPRVEERHRELIGRDDMPGFPSRDYRAKRTTVHGRAFATAWILLAV
jgi:hypothetical protein